MKRRDWSWSWRKQKFVGEAQCFSGVAKRHVIMIVEFMEGVVRRMVDDAKKKASGEEVAE
jgi:hypothetical protein